MTTITFTIYGEPKPQGSTRVIPVRAKGGGYKMRPDGRPMLVPIHADGKKLDNWRNEIAAAFLAEVGLNHAPSTSPIWLRVIFYRPRPKSHYNSKGKVKDSAPSYPTTRPDSMKLARAVEDALTGFAWKDDSQVVLHILGKRWSESGHTTEITIKVLEEVESVLVRE